VARTPAVTRESIPEDQRATFDEFVQGRGEIPATGPGSVLLYAPAVAKYGLEMARYLRTDTSLSPQVRELAMLVAARERDCQFIWNAHAVAARRVGLRDDIIDNLRDKKELANLSPAESAVVSYGREFFRTHRVSKATFDAALAEFGVLGLTELTNLMGCYAMLAFNVNAFGVELPAQRIEETLPI